MFPIPSHYDLVFWTNLEEAKFSVDVSIEVSFHEETSSFKLHQLDLECSSTPTVHINNTSHDLSVETLNSEECFSFFSPTPLPANQPLTIKLSCKGVLNDKLCGFYRSCYTHNGETRYIASTQFEAVDARRAFPCIDDPSKKATFKISCSAPNKSDFICLSNQPVESITTVDDCTLLYHFELLPCHPTYLIALVIGQFEHIETKLRDGRPLRLFARPGETSKLEFAMDVAKRSIEWFEDYFDLRYMLNKIDHVAVPNFAFGAMENTGLILYRETCLLADIESIQSKQRVAMV
ncbi:hypothetical protein RCL1_008095 [Eukaryota sp. TZLM3-RCL]